ncbi:MAG: hypothetical protein M3163_00715 [Actinomycetota bacterium]|nr:hypothetical protein [Actinomycetota bacterium]
MAEHRRSEADDLAARDLLLALATARRDGDVRTYQDLLTEATTEPARSLILIDTLVRFLLTLAGERPSEPGMCPDDLLRMVAVVLAANQDGPPPA